MHHPPLSNSSARGTTPAADEVRHLVQAAQVGAWRLQVPELVLSMDEVALALHGQSTPLSRDEFLSHVSHADMLPLRGALAPSGTAAPSWVRYHYERPDGSTVHVQLISTTLPTGLGGVLFEVPEEAGSATGMPVDVWSEEFGAALSPALTLDEIAQTLQIQGERILGARFTALCLVKGERLSFYTEGGVSYPMAEWYDRTLSDEAPIPEVVRERQPRFFPDAATMDMLYPGAGSYLKEIDAEGWAAFPLVVADRTLGALVFAWKEVRPFTPQEVRILSSVGASTAQSLERSRLYQRQQEVAETLQRAVLPTVLPSVPGLDFAARYLPAESGLEVGGDWYDLFPLPSGKLALVIGDVAGHGLPAASEMGQMRNAVRAYFLDGCAPGEVLTRLERMVSFLSPDISASVLCGEFDPQSGVLTWANAGHLPPFMECAGRVVELSQRHDPLIGAGTNMRFSEASVVLEPGGTLVLYSDGLVEERGVDLAESLERMQSTLGRSWRTSLEVHCSQVIEEVLGLRERTDDLCLLMLRRHSPAELRAGVMLGRDLEGPRRAREFVAAQLEVWGVEHLADSALLLVSEAVTNAIIHAKSAPRISLSLDDASLVVNVHDSSPLPPVRKRNSTEAVNGRGVALIDMLSTEWGVDQTEGGKDLWFSLAREGKDVEPLSLWDVEL